MRRAAPERPRKDWGFYSKGDRNSDWHVYKQRAVGYNLGVFQVTVTSIGRWEAEEKQESQLAD